MINEETVFHQARQLPAGERSAFLDEACGSNQAVRQRLDVLLQAHDNPDSQFQSKSPALAGTMGMPSVAEAPGMVIGPYKLLQQIGEGGMGVVYMAEQVDPVRRKVALKIIKPGMDTREVIVRFEAERQALALMDHPNIASVFDGGATEAGRPYFVMELVRGVPITEYCDQNHLPIHERLQLFVTVCHAVQHAHQKGVIHRDIKPSNVMVTLHDDRPVPKVIDFGVAKAISQQLTDKTLFTNFAQMVGTPLYMSPEQAQLTGLDVDTRGDIYSLGVLLYELLTGTTPVESVRMKRAAVEEIRRMIREDDPPSPSTRLSSVAGETQTAIAAHRQIDAKGLSRLVRGDLDWIVMKALEKDRTRRYDTANSFAADIERHLSDEPVEACPPSAAYRFRKFARRNKGPLVAAALIVATLVAGTTVASWQAVRALTAEDLAQQLYHDERAARSDADQARNAAEVARTVAERRRGEADEARQHAESSRQQAIVNLQRARDAVDRMLTRFGENDLKGIPEMEQVQRQLLEDALEFNQSFLADAPDDPDLRLQAAKAHIRVGNISQFLGRDAAAQAVLEPGIEMLWGLARESPEDSRPRIELVRAYIALGYVKIPDPTGRMYEDIRRRTVTLVDQLVAEQPENEEFREQRAQSYFALGLVLQNKRDPEAEAVLQQALEIAQEYGKSYWIGRSSQHLGGFCNAANRLEEAETYLRTSLEAFQQSGSRNTRNGRRSQADSRTRLGHVLARMGRVEESDEQYVQSIDMLTRLSRDYPSGAEYDILLHSAASHYGASLAARGRWEDAAAAYRTAVEAAAKQAHRSPSSALPLNNFAWLLATCPATKVRDPTRAVELAKQAAELAPDAGSHWNTLGVAQYRAGDCLGAIESLTKSMELRQGGDAFDWFFLAMAQCQLDHQEEARRWFDQAIPWMEKNQPQNEELQRFRAEAAAFLGIPETTDAPASALRTDNAK